LAYVHLLSTNEARSLPPHIQIFLRVLRSSLRIPIASLRASLYSPSDRASPIFQILRINTVGTPPVSSPTPAPEGNDPLGSYHAALERLGDDYHGTILIVTDPNHALRAELLAKQIGMNARVSPTPYCPAIFPTKGFFWTLSHEVGGLIVVAATAALFGRGVPLPEFDPVPTSSLKEDS